MGHQLFYILIRDPGTSSLLGWCLPQDLGNLRRAFPYLEMSPFLAKLSEDEMHNAGLYCGPTACAKHPEIENLLKLHDDIQREKVEMQKGVSLTIGKALFESLAKKQQEEKKRREET